MGGIDWVWFGSSGEYYDVGMWYECKYCIEYVYL